MEDDPHVYHIWQMKLLFAQIENYYKYPHYQQVHSMNKENEKSEPLISNEFCLKMKQRVNSYMDQWESQLLKSLLNYIIDCKNNGDITCNVNLQKLVSYITFYEIPKNILSNNISTKHINLLDFFMQMENLNIEPACVHNIMKLLNIHSDLNM